MRVRFIYKKEPRQFNYVPRHYDPEKEARERRRQELVGARPTDGEYVPGEMIRSKSSIRREELYSKRSKQKGKSLKLVLMIALIIAIGLWIFLL